MQKKSLADWRGFFVYFAFFDVLYHFLLKASNTFAE